MLYDALITLDLPHEVGPPLPTGVGDGIVRLLFTGAWWRRAATCSLSSASVLAGCHAVVRGLPVAGRPALHVVDDAGELLDLAAAPEGWGEAPAPFAEVLPPRWTTEPCSFRLRASFDEGGFAVVVWLRFTPRHDVEHAALSGAVRVLWAPEDAGARLTERVTRDGARLGRLVQQQGERVVEALGHAMTERFGRAPAARSRLVVLVPDARGDAAFDDLLDGFPPQARAAVLPTTEALSGAWSALRADGIEGRWTRGAFVPTAEVAHVV
jgi:hypothetical protein